ncbi:unnamed protein product [Nezara viridula]|uniref:Uncharacterized protein n=1 Tax=Nezara viridula TaxID=85310 RepID=A0A9P0HL25_NEZVI|nr:unnamed protein product [Nezara viridula]
MERNGSSCGTIFARDKKPIIGGECSGLATTSYCIRPAAGSVWSSTGTSARGVQVRWSRGAAVLNGVLIHVMSQI